MSTDRPTEAQAQAAKTESKAVRRAGAFVRSRWFPFVGILVFALVVGIWIGDDYGMSWDEQSNFVVGADASQAYLSPAQYEDYLQAGDPLAHHGPSYFMSFYITSKAIVAAFPDWHRADGRHLSNYLTFLMGAAAFYWLSLRWLPSKYAAMSTLLLLTQPLLFGHAFINQKDTPFLAFFTMSIALGLAAADSVLREQSRSNPCHRTWPPGEAAFEPLTTPGSPPWKKVLWAGVSVAAVLFILVLLNFESIHEVATNLLQGAFDLSSNDVGPASDIPATDIRGTLAGPVLDSLSHAYKVLRGMMGAIAGCAAVLALRKSMPDRTVRCVPYSRTMIILLVLAGAFAGFTASIRPIGLFAGALVMVYWGMRVRGIGWDLLVTYWLIAAWMVYQTWPWLWTAPIHRLWESLRLTADFGGYPTLYRGVLVSSDSLPWHYYPTLAAVELTLPMLVLFPAGLGIALTRVVTRRLDPPTTVVVGLWFAIPLVALLVLGVDVYNNLRQLHFALVPGFLLAGLALEPLLSRLKNHAVQYALFLALLAPGIVASVQLHPYEYAYFNALVGGVEGAHGKFATEYWCTSLREAMEYINQVAAPGSLVKVKGPTDAAEPFAREDLVVRRVVERPGDADYIVTCNDKLGQDEGLAKVFEVSRGRAVFAEVFARREP